MKIPALQTDGLLPPGLYLAGLQEIEERFGKSTRKRAMLYSRLKMFVILAQHCGASRVFVNGSFVTQKPEPGDIDVVIWLGKEFLQMLLEKDSQALLLQQMFLRRKPEEAFLVTDQQGWDEWFEFFSVFKSNPKQRKGLIEVKLK